MISNEDLTAARRRIILRAAISERQAAKNVPYLDGKALEEARLGVYQAKRKRFVLNAFGMHLACTGEPLRKY